MVLAVCALLPAVVIADGPETYECVGLGGAVFAYNKAAGKWQAFEPSEGTQLRVTRRGAAQYDCVKVGRCRPAKWVVVRADGYEMAACYTDFDERGRLHCEGDWGINERFMLDRNSLRFVSALVEFDSDPETPLMPQIEMGRCIARSTP